MKNETNAFDASKTDEDEILNRVKKKLNRMHSFNSNQYEQIKSDKEFSSGHQWSEEVRNEREVDGRPTVTTNITKNYINTVVNPLRLKPIGIRISSMEEKVTQLLSGIIKDIEMRSNAYEAYEVAYENAVTAGIGFIGISTDYVSKDSLEQKIVIDSFKDPTMVFIDEYSTKVDGSDANHGAFVKFINSDDVEDEDSKGTQFNLFSEVNIPEGSTAEMIFYEMERKTGKMYFYEDGTQSEELDENKYVVAEKDVPSSVCHIFKFIGSKLVNQSELPIDFVPLVPVYGDSLYLENSSNLRYGGLVHLMRETQEKINFYASNELELVAKAPKTPIIGAAGVFEGFEDRWGSANHKSHAYLEYNQTDLEGNPAPAPQRMDNNIQTQGLAAAREQAIGEIGRQTGIMDTQFGMQQANESGRAVLLRQNQGEISTAHYLQNLESSISQVGKIVLQLMPYVYDTTRRLTVRGESVQMLNDNLSTFLTPEVLKDLEVETESGPSYEGRRREAVAAILEIGSVMPEKMPAMADLLIENLDAPGSKEIAKRLKKLLPPELQDENEQQKAQMIADLQMQAQQSTLMLEQAQGVIAGQQDQMMQLQNSINQLQTMVLSKEQETRAKIYNADADRQIDIAKTQMNNETKIYQEQIKQSGSDERQTQKIVAEFQKEQSEQEHELDKEMLKLEGKLIEKAAPSASDEINAAKEFIPKVPGPVSTDISESQQMIDDIDGFVNN